MKHKKAQTQRSNVGVYLILFLVLAIILLFLGNLTIWLGAAALIICIILFLSGEDELGLIFLIAGVILLLGGVGIKQFFNHNEVGKLWLNGGETVVNATAETYKTTKELLP
jgi:hypothetical protein